MSPLPRDTMEILLPLEPGFLSVVRLAVAGAGTRAGLDIAEIEDAKVAVCEACTNVIEHAYPAEKGLGPEGFIRVRLTVHAGEHICIVTHGGPIREILRRFDLWGGGIPASNASWTELRVVNNTMTAELLRLMDTSHLPPDLRSDGQGTRFISQE